VNIYFDLLLLPLIGIAAAAIGLVTLAARRPAIPGSGAFFWLGLAVAVWSAAGALELSSVAVNAKLLWVKLQCISAVVVPVAWMVFVLLYTGRSERISPQFLLALLIVPAVSVGLLFTHGLNGLVFADFRTETGAGVSALKQAFGAWFWIQLLHSYVLMFIGALYLALAFSRSPRYYRGQLAALLVAALVPWAGNALLLGGYGPFRNPALAHLGFLASAAVLVWSVVCRRFLEVAPITYDRVISSMSDGVLIMDDRMRILDLNTAAQSILNIVRAEVIGRPAAEALAKWPELLDSLRRTAESRGEIPIVEEGRQRHFDLRISPIHDRRRMAGSLVVLREITRRKQYETALRESEALFRGAFNQALIGMVLVSLEGDFLSVNPYICQMLGYSEKELLALNTRDITYPDDLEPGNRQQTDLLEGRIAMVLQEKRYIRRDGRIVWGRLSSSLLRNGDHRPAYLLAHIQDITDQKQVEEEKKVLERQTQIVQRLEALGTLAGGIAHDFNNILMSIQGNVSLLNRRLNRADKDVEKLLNIEHYIQSGAKLTQQLLGFARGGKYEVRPLNLNDVLDKTSQMFGRTRKDITIITAFEKNPWTVNADQSQIEQVLLNLYVNASHAMANGGTLFLETTNLVLDDNYIKPYKINPGRYVKFSVTDTGVGMEAAIQQRIFEPFFTTKEMGRGTGLGLASVYGIVKNHGGYINVYSEKGAGSTFNVYMPAVDRKAAADEAEMVLEAASGTGTILFVDDEDMIVTTGRELLSELGYDVVTAAGGQEAVDIFATNPTRFDLVILDMIMPHMNGRETYLRMKSINPQVKVLLSSGYSLNHQAAAIIEEGCDGFIQKPFNTIQLSRKIREILDSSA
jgi:two-component system cell cycle sensor histidine kinase/response regulator CckA